MTRILVGTLLVVCSGLVLAGCAKSGCIGGGETCRTEPPCQKVAFTCGQTELSVKQLAAPSERLPGTNALGSVGDWEMSNAFTHVVIAGLGHQNFLDPNGGSILDLTSGEPGATDTVNQILQVVGVLPSESARFTSIEKIEEPGLVALQLRGTLDGRADQPIYTRYELRACDHGVRVRTEVLNGSPDNQLYTLSDGFYWSKREPIPFTPEPGAGFEHPSFGLTTIDGVIAKFPYLAASGHNGEAGSIAAVNCLGDSLSGFNSETVSAAGLPRTVVPPRGWLALERFIAVANTKDVAAPIAIALEVRKQVLGETSVTLTGKVDLAGGLALDSEREVSVLISQGTLADGPEKRTPWTQTVPAADGTFTATVPASKPLVVEVHSFGVKQAEKEFAAPSADLDLGTFTLPSTAQVKITVKDKDTSQPINAEIYVVPADDETKLKVTGSLFGQFTTCSPWLGPPPGASPACNRILVHDGQATVEIPVGQFYFYAFHGPFWMLERQTATLTTNVTKLDFALSRLALQPAGTVSGDLHVHGAASFDSSIPDFDRVLSFAATDLQVIVATDHDVVHDYGDIVASLGLQANMSTVTGVETTGHIPWLKVPGYIYPLVIGHYNLWPLKYDPALPRNGGPFDELIEPGELFDRTVPLFQHGVDHGVIELNHPWADAEFGRDLGFPKAIFLNTLKDLPATDDGTTAGVYVRAPKGGLHNNDHHAQEVMNGSQNDTLLQYRAFWWFTLNQGQLKTGTANSDSHSLVDSTVGMPRNIITAATAPGPAFDVDKFNAGIREGKVLGTNGPVIEATIDALDGSTRGYSLEPMKPLPTGKLHVKVWSAPWVPIEEVRFIVNGQAVKTLPFASDPPVAVDPFGSIVITGFFEVNLSELVAGVTGDAWVVIEAGRHLPIAADLGGGLNNTLDGIPDTGDNNGDGVVTTADIEDGEDYGPLNNPPAPLPTEAGFHFYQVTEGYPFAFTNPFVLDRDGNGRFDAPGVKGGR